MKNLLLSTALAASAAACGPTTPPATDAATDAVASLEAAVDAATDAPPADAPADAPPVDAGPVQRVTDSPCRPLGADGMPAVTLAATGCFVDVRAQEPARGLVPYGVNAPLWSDGTLKRRWVLMPPTGNLTFAVDGPWEFPDGTILVKEFAIETTRGDASTRRPVETRFLVLRGVTWQGYNYQWNAAGDAAALLPPNSVGPMGRPGTTETYTITDPASPGTPVTYTHLFPSRSQCNECHRPASGGALGLRTEQLNREQDYGTARENQLAAFESAGFFGGPLPSRPADLPRWVDASDPSHPADVAARSYLAANCAHCHNPGGVSTGSRMDLRFETPLNMTNLCLPDAPVMVPGSPTTSRLYTRATVRGPMQMPPLGTGVVDPTEQSVLGAWIMQMAPADCAAP